MHPLQIVCKNCVIFLNIMNVNNSIPFQHVKNMNLISVEALVRGSHEDM